MIPTSAITYIRNNIQTSTCNYNQIKQTKADIPYCTSIRIDGLRLKIRFSRQCMANTQWLECLWYGCIEIHFPTSTQSSCVVSMLTLLTITITNWTNNSSLTWSNLQTWNATPMTIFHKFIWSSDTTLPLIYLFIFRLDLDNLLETCLRT